MAFAGELLAHWHGQRCCYSAVGVVVLVLLVVLLVLILAERFGEKKSPTSSPSTGTRSAADACRWPSRVHPCPQFFKACLAPSPHGMVWDWPRGFHTGKGTTEPVPNY
eukprot:3941143-Rhodomonas_salina.2